jgi:hypothetical protein
MTVKFDCAGNVGGIQGHSQGPVFPIVEYRVGDNDYRSLAPFARGCELSSDSEAGQSLNSAKLKELERLADLAAQSLQSSGGFSVGYRTTPTIGYMVAVVGQEVIVPVKDSHGLARNDYAAIYRYLFERADFAECGNYIGGWIGPDNNLYLDVSVHVGCIDDADKLARDHAQIAYYNLATGQSVYVDYSVE